MPTITLNAPAEAPPERILVFGVEGTGKSNNVLAMARRIPTATFHVIDNDVSPSYRRALTGEYADLTNVNVTETDPDDWEDVLDAIRRIAPTVNPGDWLVVDSMSPAWQAVQSWYTAKKFGRGGVDDDVDAYFTKAKAKAGKKDDDDGDYDWVFINAQYAKLTAALFKCAGNVYITAEQKNLGSREDKQNTATYGAFGVKPAGQKRLGHMTHTVLLATKNRRGEFLLDTVKDRSRVDVEGLVVADFAKDYLQGVAGWKVGVVKGEVA